MSHLIIQLLGGFNLVYNDEPVTGVNSGRLQSLLAYLLLHHQIPQSRQHIAFLFWPESSESQARTNLRQLIYHLRKAWPEIDRFLTIDEDLIRWHMDAGCSLDVAKFEQQLDLASRQSTASSSERKHLERAIDLYQGPLLPGSYEEWLLEERSRLEKKYTWALDRLMTILEELREYPTAIRLAEELLRLDPIDEKTYRRLMRLHAMNGDRTAALRVYHDCLTTLKHELGIEPDKATREAHQRLLDMPEDIIQPGALTTLLAENQTLVGRYNEWRQLLSCWHEMAIQQPHFVIILGEAGLGKSRLAEELVNWAQKQGIAVASTRSYASLCRLSYSPIAEWLRDPTIHKKLKTLDTVWLTEVARLLPELLAEIPGLPKPQPLTDGWQQSRFFEAIVHAVCNNHAALLLSIDDLQWCDLDSLVWLRYLLRYKLEIQLLVIATARPEELPPGHPALALISELRKSGQLTEIELPPLDRQETHELAKSTAGCELYETDLDHLYASTEGIPLYIVEAVRAVMIEKGSVESPPTQDALQGSEFASWRLSSKVQAVIEARLQQLSPSARELSELAATIGRQFTFRVLHQACDLPENELVKILDELWQKRIFRDHGPDAYDFSHDRIREVAYAQLSPVKRHWLHKRVAEALEQLHAGNSDAVSAQMGFHFEQAGIIDKAIACYHRAGLHAQRIYANQEALGLLYKALALLKTHSQPAAWIEQECSLQLSIANLERIIKGYAAVEVEKALDRACEICLQLGERVKLFHALFGLWSVYLVRGNLPRANASGRQIQAIALDLDEPDFLLAAHFTLGGLFTSQGDFEQAQHHFEESLSLYNASQRPPQITFFEANLGVFTRGWYAHTLWHLGDHKAALQMARSALQLAQEISHPFSQAIAMAYLAMLHQMRGEIQECQTWASLGYELCTKHGIDYYVRWQAILLAWTKAMQQPDEKNIQQLRHCISEFKAAGSGLRLPLYYGLLAEALAARGDFTTGLECLNEALSVSRRNSDHCWDGELFRLKGELLQRTGANTSQVEQNYRQAIKITERQGARSLTLRAKNSLYRLRNPVPIDY